MPAFTTMAPSGYSFESADIVAHGVGIPPGPAEQVLHAVRAGLLGLLGDAPAVLSRQVRQQPQHRDGVLIGVGS
jgi:hypothetical protein